MKSKDKCADNLEEQMVTEYFVENLPHFFQEKISKNGEVKACELMVLQSPKAITMEWLKLAQM